MGYFAQKVYPQNLGNDPHLSIADAGCLLTSYCNLRVQKGENPVDPPTLNNWFLANNDYLRDADSYLEDLSWADLPKYDARWSVAQVGTSAIPPAPTAGLGVVVKFYYQSVQSPWLDTEKTKPNMINHFCIVSKVVNNQVYIIDSWDGVEKAPSTYQGTYHAPIGWCAYNYAVPQTSAPAAPSAPAAAAPAPSYSSTSIAAPVLPNGNSSRTYQVQTTLKGYTNATFALQGANWKNALVEPGTYFVYNEAYGMVNVTKQVGKPGSWINPALNVAPAPAAATPSNQFVLNGPVPGYITSNEAANHIDATVTVGAGNYLIFNQAHGMVNVTKVPGKPGAWINPSDNPNVDQGKGEGADINAWQKTFKKQPGEFWANKTVAVQDLSGVKPPITLHEDQIVPIEGYFTGPDGAKYAQTVTSAVPSKRTKPELQKEPVWWYGIHVEDLDALDKTDTVTRLAIGRGTWYDKLVKTLAKVRG